MHASIPLQVKAVHVGRERIAHDWNRHVVADFVQRHPGEIFDALVAPVRVPVFDVDAEDRRDEVRAFGIVDFR